MQKKLCKVVYDTEISTVVKKVTYGNFGESTGYEETLYITDKGTYFLYTNGGAESKYTEEKITLKYKPYAQKWLEENK